MSLIRKFRFTTQKTSRPIQSLERGMEETRARYEQYLRTTSENFVAKKSNVTIKDPHTMAGDSYWTLRENIDTINLSAKNANKEVTFEDARALTRDDEFVSPIIENSLASKIMITVKDKLRGANSEPKQAMVDVFEQPEKSLMEKVSEKLNELFIEK